MFFFQAEDGIRVGHVTGVQTCALPISLPEAITHCRVFKTDWELEQMREAARRSEERRVGKECRTRRGLGPEKKKETTTQFPGALNNHALQWRTEIDQDNEAADEVKARP